ncbi:MAG TPA: GNAT family N-acetyltransferase [Thermomicrobiales bacterium]|nr:GNAT family N-acetyltransferase [Thermomicrobiales bacterium]
MGATLTPGFRLAGRADVETLVGFMREFYAIDAYPFDAAVARAALARLVGDPALGRAWLILDGEAPIGYVVLTLGYSLEFHGRDAFVDELFIREAYRRRGAGAAALRFVEEQCPALGVHALHLEVERTNLAGQALYRKLGFRDHDRYLMTRWLTE